MSPRRVKCNTPLASPGRTPKQAQSCSQTRSSTAQSLHSPTSQKRVNSNREQKQYEQAERLYQRALSLQECVLGAHHPEIAKTLQDFAVLQETQGKLQEAASLYQRALAIREATLGIQR